MPNLWDHFVNKNYSEAISLANQSLQDSKAYDAMHVTGLSLVSLGHLEEGIGWLMVSLTPEWVKSGWFTNAALVLSDKHDYYHAMILLASGLERYPDNPKMLYMQGVCMGLAGRWDESLAYFDKALVFDPKLRFAKFSKGFSLNMLGHNDAAIQHYKELRDDPDNTVNEREEAIGNWACVLMEQGKPWDALALLDPCSHSTFPLTLFNRSIVYLGLGIHWPEAWELHRSRTQVEIRGEDNCSVTTLPRPTSLNDIRGKHVHFVHEQGLGDVIQFVRYARLLRPHVAELTIELPDVMLRIMRYFDLASWNVNHGSHPPDYGILMIDAPALLGTTIETIPDTTPYFLIPQHEIDQRRLPPPRAAHRVGLVWSGSFSTAARRQVSDKRRSMPYETMRVLIDQHPDIEFVSLQLPDHQVDDPRLLQPLQQEFDVLDTAAIIRQLDLVITIDTAVAHLAGALATPVWMLSRFDGCWRWGWNDREDTSWYRTMTIFRQQTPYTWPDVINRVSDRLNIWINGGLNGLGK